MNSLQFVPATGFPDWRPRMQGKVKERWMQLCEEAAVEQNGEGLMTLIDEIDRMLEEKEERLKHQLSQRC